MSMQPHPVVIAAVGKQRQEDLLAQAHSNRLAKLAQHNTERRQQWPDLPAVVAVMAALALLLAVGSVVGDEPSRPERSRLGRGDGRAITQVLDERHADPGAAQTVGAARL